MPGGRLGGVGRGRRRSAAGADRDRPWGVSFAGPTGRTALASAAGQAGGPGRLGLRTAGGWFPATRVERARRDGARSSRRSRPATPGAGGSRSGSRRVASGVIGLRATVLGGLAEAVGASFGARAGERYLGFGERSNAVDQRGRRGRELRRRRARTSRTSAPLIAGSIPPPGFRPRDDATYFPMPWLLSTAGYGVLVDNDETSTFRLGERRADAWSVEVAGAASSSCASSPGPRPADVLRRLTARVGRQPPPPRRVYFGPWFQPAGDDEPRPKLRRAARPPTRRSRSAQTYTPLPARAATSRAASDERARRVGALHAAGLAVTTYFNPMICTTYTPRYAGAAAAGALTQQRRRRARTLPLHRPAVSSTVGQFDFSGAGRPAFYGTLLDEAVADGHDGWMEDFGEYTPRGLALGRRDARRRDAQPLPACSTTARRSASRARRGGRSRASTARAGPARRAARTIVWGGDPTTDWGFDGLRPRCEQALTMGLSGVVSGARTSAASSRSPRRS